MSVSAIKVTLGVDQLDGSFGSSTSYPSDPLALATTADTAVALVLTDYDTAAASIVAISGDTYSAVTHQFTTGGATGLTSAQLHTQMALLNTMATALIAAKAATVAAKAPLGGNLVVLIDTAVITTSNGVKWAINLALQAAKNLGIVSP